MHAKLLVFEQERKRLLFFMFIGAVLLFIATALVLTFNMFALSVFVFIPWGLLFHYYRLLSIAFTDRFKPLVVRSLLEFMDNKLTYYHKEFISKDTFLRSRIFPVNPELYYGEDYIMGKVGETFFEMSELELYNVSEVKAKLEKWFQGIFFHANFNTNFKGRIVLIPRQEWQRFIPVMKDFTKYGGYELVNAGGGAEFDEAFLIYVDRDIHYKDILTAELMATIYGYYISSGKKVYASFYNSHFYMAINEHRNLLEASVLHSNLDFELITAFYKELLMFTELVQDFDIRH